MEKRMVSLHLELFTDAPLEILKEKDQLNLKYWKDNIWWPIPVEQVTVQVIQDKKKKK